MSASSMNKQSNMNGMTIYVARNRDMLLAIKLVNTLKPTMQRPLSKTANEEGDYTLVVYEKNHGYNNASLRSVRLTSSTYGKMESQHHVETCPHFAKLLRDSRGDNEPTSFEELGLCKSTIQRLISNDVKNVVELLAIRKSLLRKLPNVGKTTLEEIEETLTKYKLKLNPYT